MTEPTKTPTRPRRGFYFLAPVAAWLLLECVSALTLMILPPEPEPAALPEEDPEWLVSAKDAWKNGFFGPDIHTIWRPSPGYREKAHRSRRYGEDDLAIDDNGHRVIPDSPPKSRKKPKDVRRVMLVGGSHPFGMWVNPSESYIEVLGQLLNAEGKHTWEVMNAACPGHTTFQGRKYIEEYGLDFEPDIILFDLGMNDSLPLSIQYASADHEVQAVPTWAARLSGTLTSLPSYRLLKKGLAGFVGKPKPAQVRVPMNLQLENQAAVRDLGEKEGYKTLFFSQVSVMPPERGGAAQCKYRPEGFEPYVDICGSFEELQAKAGFYFHDPIHANAEGHAIIGNAVYEKLKEIGWTE